MKVYSPSEVAELLKIKNATLRKYAIMLEKQGYRIHRNSQNHRYFVDEDINEIEESKKQIAAAEEKKKKGFLSRMFGK